MSLNLDVLVSRDGEKDDGIFGERSMLDGA